MLMRSEAITESGAAWTPFDSLIEMQRAFLRLNLEATAKLSRCSMQFMGPAQFDPMPLAPLQVFAFFNDCAKLSMAPVSMIAASALSPASQLMGGFALAAEQAAEQGA